MVEVASGQNSEMGLVRRHPFLFNYIKKADRTPQITLFT
jgi:hypothetical protein